MNPIRFAAGIAVLIGTLFSMNQLNGGVVYSSTVLQDGQKIAYSGNLTNENLSSGPRPGSASRIGTFDFSIPNPQNLEFIRARIQFWVQLPPEAIGDLAPQLVFSRFLPQDQPDLDAALISGDAIKTDIRISYNLFPSGSGIVEKRIDFQNLTSDQNNMLSEILSQDPQQRVDVWLASDTLTAITVPKNVMYYAAPVGGFPTLTVRNFTSTLDLEAIPEPSTSVIVGVGMSLFLQRSLRDYRRRKKSGIKGA